MATTSLPVIVYESLYREKAAPHRKRLYLPLLVELSTGQKLLIPAGYVTDLATVPRLFWGIIATSGRHDLAAIAHDYLLESGCKRSIADKEMLYLLKVCKVSWVKRNVMYASVRIYSCIKNIIRFPQHKIKL